MPRWAEASTKGLAAKMANVWTIVLGAVLGGAGGAISHFAKRRRNHPILPGRVRFRERYARSRSSGDSEWRRSDVALTDGGLVVLAYPKLLKWTPSAATIAAPADEISRTEQIRFAVRIHFRDGRWIEIENGAALAREIHILQGKLG